MAKYHAVRPSVPPSLVKTAIVNAHARKMTNAWKPCRKFFIRAGLVDGSLMVGGHSRRM